MDGWNTSFLLGWPLFRGYVTFREGNDSSRNCIGQNHQFLTLLDRWGLRFVYLSWWAVRWRDAATSDHGSNVGITVVQLDDTNWCMIFSQLSSMIFFCLINLHIGFKDVWSMFIGLWISDVYIGCGPLPSNSHHQDYYIFNRESQPKPSFTTVTGRGATPNVYKYVSQSIGFFMYVQALVLTLTKDESQVVLQGNLFHVGRDNQHLTGVIKSKLIQMYGDFEGFPL